MITLQKTMKDGSIMRTQVIQDNFDDIVLVCDWCNNEVADNKGKAIDTCGIIEGHFCCNKCMHDIEGRGDKMETVCEKGNSVSKSIYEYYIAQGFVNDSPYPPCEKCGRPAGMISTDGDTSNNLCFDCFLNK